MSEVRIHLSREIIGDLWRHKLQVVLTLAVLTILPGPAFAWLAPFGLALLPLAVLAATILMALGSLLDFGSFAKTWRYSRADFAAQAKTATVGVGHDRVA